jgi:hypothetical protein
VIARNFDEGMVQAFCNSLLEGAGDFVGMAAAHAILRDGQQQRAEIEFAAFEGKWDTLRSGERDFASESEKRGDNVKQAAYGGCREGADLLAHEFGGDAVALGKGERSGKDVGQIFDLGEESGGGLNGVVRGGVSAGERRGAQVSHAGESLLHTADESLAAPDGAVVTVSGAVEADADHALRPLSAFGEDGGDVGAMVLDRDRLRGAQRGCVRRRKILRMEIVNDEQFVAGTSYIETRSSIVS